MTPPGMRSRSKDHRPTAGPSRSKDHRSKDHRPTNDDGGRSAYLNGAAMTDAVHFQIATDDRSLRLRPSPFPKKKHTHQNHGPPRNREKWGAVPADNATDETIWPTTLRLRSRSSFPKKAAAVTDAVHFQSATDDRSLRLRPLSQKKHSFHIKTMPPQEIAKKGETVWRKKAG